MKDKEKKIFVTPGSHYFQENWKYLVISCFFVLFSRVLFSPTFIQGLEIASFKPMLTYWPTRLVVGEWTASSLLVFYIPHGYIYTYIHSDTHVPTPTHMSTMICTYTHTSNSLLSCQGSIVFKCTAHGLHVTRESSLYKMNLLTGMPKNNSISTKYNFNQPLLKHWFTQDYWS